MRLERLNESRGHREEREWLNVSVSQALSPAPSHPFAHLGCFLSGAVVGCVGALAASGTSDLEQTPLYGSV